MRWLTGTRHVLDCCLIWRPPGLPVPPGIEKGSPVIVAVRNASGVLLLKGLLDFGADVDSSGTDGSTTLIHAVRNDNASFALLLLEYGADINATSATGAAPLTIAITHNSYSVLRLILDRWHEYSDCPRLKALYLLQIRAATQALNHSRSSSARITSGEGTTKTTPLEISAAVSASGLVLRRNRRKFPECLLELELMLRVPARVDSELTVVDDDEDGSENDSDNSFEDALEKLQVETGD